VTCTPAERLAALRMMFAHLGESACAHRVANVYDLISAGEIDAEGIFVARHGGALQGVFVCIPMPGASALVWPPRGDPAVFDALIAEGLGWLRRRGMKLAETIVAVADADTLAPLAAHGFVPAGPMHFLRCPVDGHVERPRQLDLVPLSDVTDAVIAATLDRTYQGTLDFPELSGIRTPDDVLAAYRTNPILRPEHCRLALHDGQPAGILLLGEVVTLEGWDLNYLGVVPQRRRQGLGRALVNVAIDIVSHAGGTHLDIAVDARNAPAIQLYTAAGFQLFDRRLVSLVFLANDS
jgi:ribosomal protein S18 acetylase RimI-like enzyme